MDLTPGRNRKDRVVPWSSNGEGPSNPHRAAAATAADNEPRSKNTSFNTTKYLEDCEAVKARLSDLDFDIRKYPDPCMPQERRVVYPAGTDASTEAYYKELIKKYYVPPAAPPKP